MARIFRYPLRVAALSYALLGIALASHVALAQQRVGVDSAVNPAATGIPPGALPRRLVLGQDVVFNERITTEAQGQTQILFVDESTLSVGPNANLVVDQFVYDPNAGTGKLAASLGRGVFRFVGGKLSKQDNAVTMRTPTATIGIRGGVMLVRVRPDCTAPASLGASGCNALQVIFVYGKGVTVTGLNGASQTLTRPGFEVTVSGPGASPSDPGPAPPGATAAMLAQLDGRAGGTGGAPVAPTEVTVTNSGIANVISANVPASIQAAAKTQPAPAQAPNANQTVQYTVPPTTYQVTSVPPVSPTTAMVIPTPFIPPQALPIQQAAASGGSGGGGSGSSGGGSGGGGTGGGGGGGGGGNGGNMGSPINIPNVAGGYADTGTQGTALGFVAPVPVSLYGPVSPYAGASVVNSVFSGPGHFTFPLTAGAATTISSSTGTMSPLGPVTGTTYLSSDQTFFFADLTPVNHPTQREFVYGGTPVNSAFYTATSTTPTYLAFAVQPDAALQSNIPFIRNQTGVSLANSSVSPLVFAIPAGSSFSTPSTSVAPTKALQASLSVNGSGASQSSVLVVLVGNVFGLPPIMQGVIHGSILSSATAQPTRINSYYQTPVDSAGNSFYGKNSITGFALSPGAGASNAVEVNTATQTITANYQFAQPAIPTGVPAAANGAQTTQTLSGYFGGIMTKEPTAGVGNPLPYAVTGNTSISTNATNSQIAATLTGGDPFTSTTSGIPAPASNGIVIQYGNLNNGQPGATSARQAFISDNYFAVLESPPGGASSTVNSVAITPSTSFPNTNPNLYLVTSTAAPTTTLLPNGLCSTCQYLQWGYWGGELDTPASGNLAARTDVGHINFWVAGTPLTSMTDIASLQAMNFAGTYNGNLVGAVVNNGAQYLASGGLQATYQFGTQTGSFAVSNYDHQSFTATGHAPLSGSNYGFRFNSGAITGAVNGAFYGPLAAETGGNFAFTAGPAYTTAGVFAAKR